jgi:hypothetical protein
MNNDEEPKQTKAFTARLPEKMVHKLDKIAKENHWSRATALRVLLAKELVYEQK